MKTIQSRFGEIAYDPADTLLFADGLLGFEELRHFVVMPSKEGSVLFWIQSVEDPQVAFILTDPHNFFLDYHVVPDEKERQVLGIGPDDECLVVNIVTVPPSRKVTVNLAAPILFAPSTNRALQVIIEGNQFSTQTALPEVGPDKKDSEQKQSEG